MDLCHSATVMKSPWIGRWFGHRYHIPLTAFCALGS